MSTQMTLMSGYNLPMNFNRIGEGVIERSVFRVYWVRNPKSLSITSSLPQSLFSYAPWVFRALSNVDQIQFLKFSMNSFWIRSDLLLLTFFMVDVTVTNRSSLTIAFYSKISLLILKSINEAFLAFINAKKTLSWKGVLI